MREERELVDYLREQGALSPDAATALEPQRGLGGAGFRTLVRHGVVAQTAAGLFWLNEAAFRKTRARRSWGFVGATMILLILAIAAGVIVAYTQGVLP